MLHKMLEEAQIKEGIMVAMSLHTTAGITINKNADPDVKRTSLSP